MTPDTVVAVVCAAGESRRLGRPKQLIKVGDRTLIRRSLDAIAGAGIKNTIVVTGAWRESVEATLSAEVEAVWNEGWRDGLGSSIAVGVSCALRLYPDAAGILVMLSDQPFVTSSHLNSLIDELGESDSIHAVSTRYSDSRMGVPAVFDPDWVDHLLGLQGDAGARKLLNQNAGSVCGVTPNYDCSDIDTEADLARLGL